MNSKNIIFLLVLIAILITSCKESHNKNIDVAYQLTTTAPDSALSILNGVKQKKLSEAEKARFALVYTIAQDKSGLDVDNDSLLRTAYTYYNARPANSLYAKCEYYMGKYYMLSDSLELAIDCFQKSANTAEKQGDKYTLCLAFEKLSNAFSDSNPMKGLSVAKKADSIYSCLPNATISNKTYSKLQISRLYLFADSIEKAVKTCQDAIKLARESKDSACISVAYQDMANILGEKREYGIALMYSKKSLEYSVTPDIHKKLNLAWAYIDADSIHNCQRILDNIKTNDPKDLYTTFYLLHLAAIKSHDYSEAINFADSSYHYLEQMYIDELSNKEKYYNALVKTQYEKGVSEGKADWLTLVIILTFSSALVIICLITYNYKQYKIRASQKMKTVIKEREMEEKLHREELKYKEIQLNTMRNYILKKIDIAQKIKTLRGNKNKSVALTEEDWEEIQMFIDNIDRDFVSRLKKTYPNLDKNDLRFMILIRLKMPSKALGLIYNISEKSIRQKLFVYKSKFGLESERKQSLRTFIENF